MRILYIDQYFSTRQGISGTRGYEFARRWVAAGHEVTMLCGTSRYSHLDMEPQRRLLRRTNVDGIDVLVVRVPYAQQMGVAGRLRAFLAFMFWAALVGLFTARHDVVFASSTPLTVGVPAVLISRLRGTPFVFEVRDLWPRAPMEMGAIKNPMAIALARAAEKLFYRTAVKVVALSPGMVEGVLDAGKPEDDIVLVPNCCDLDLFADADAGQVREELGLADEDVVVIHAGNLGPSNDGDWLLNLARGWLEADEHRLRLLLLGEGSRRSHLERRCEREGLTNVVFAGPVTRAATAAYVRAADFGIVSFADVPVLKTNSPNKFFDYLAAGLPVLVNTNGWTAQLLAENEAGLLLPRHPENAARQVAELAADPKRRAALGRNARRLSERFERGKLATEVLNTLETSQLEKTCGLEPALKRLIDMLGAALTLVLLSPFLLVTALAIKVDSRGSVFFRQRRTGRDGRAFQMWKFRTMVTGAADLGNGLNVGERDPRITRLGRWLREWSLDELPQIINVLLGDMSLVGPRPVLEEHVEQYDQTQRERLRVRPGLTGLAQISGRNALTWPQKLAFDVQYARTWSWWRDLVIIVKTIPVVFRREGLYESDAGKNDKFNEFDDGDH
ncbi:MAG: sugar transferase [Candidatus Lernaella stagnicola]|nr:sugar transferase [Candidatus Lernaella stagnicola]